MKIEKVKKKDTVRVSKKDLLKLLADNEHLQNQVTELQTQMTKLVEEVRVLKATRPAPEPENFNPPDNLFDPNIYIDGANDFRNGLRFGRDDE